MPVNVRPFAGFAGACAIGAGLAGLVHEVAWLGWYASGSQALGAAAAAGLLVAATLAAPALVGLYERIRAQGDTLAILALLGAVVSTVILALDSGSDLARALRGVIPSPAGPDPGEVATFGLVGLAVLIFAWLMVGASGVPWGLAVLTLVAGGMLILTYLAWLALPAGNPIEVGAAAVEGVAITPAWYVWLGRTLRRPPLLARRL